MTDTIKAFRANYRGVRLIKMNDLIPAPAPPPPPVGPSVAGAWRNYVRNRYRSLCRAVSPFTEYGIRG